MSLIITVRHKTQKDKNGEFLVRRFSWSSWITFADAADYVEVSRAPVADPPKASAFDPTAGGGCGCR